MKAAWCRVGDPTILRNAGLLGTELAWIVSRRRLDRASCQHAGSLGQWRVEELGLWRIRGLGGRAWSRWPTDLQVRIVTRDADSHLRRLQVRWREDSGCRS